MWNKIGWRAKIKRSCENVTNFTSRRHHVGLPMIVIRWHLRPPEAPQELNYEVTSQTCFAAHASSRLFSGRNVDLTRESGGNRAYPIHWATKTHGKQGHLTEFIYDRCPGFDSCPGLRTFLCPTLVSCWLIHLRISLPSLKFTIIINLSLISVHILPQDLFLVLITYMVHIHISSWIESGCVIQEHVSHEFKLLKVSQCVRKITFVIPGQNR